jgi:Glycosyl hydrolase family 26
MQVKLNRWLLLIGFFCTLQAYAQTENKPELNLTAETAHLLRNLQQLKNSGTMMGHQDDLAYGVGWKYEKGRSDVKESAGDYPAVYGWELGHLEIDRPHNLDSVPFDRMQQLIREGYERGGLITISWHLNNPLTGKSAWDPAEGTVASILPGGAKHTLFKSWLDKVAFFMNGLKGKKGELIPVLFRPFHELNGNWFWWGGKHCTPEEFKKLWQFTVGYLRNEKHLHHLLYAYNTDRFQSKEEYFSKYPGDEWVDVIGFDIYQRNTTNEQFRKDLDTMLTLLEEMAGERKKIPALTEFGGNNNDAGWWTQTFLPVLLQHRISYVLAWRNAGQKADGEFEYYLPYKQHAAAADFKTFRKHRRILFQRDLKKKKLYK